MELRFSKELYSKTALIKAAYNFTDIAYVHLDADDDNWLVSLEAKSGMKAPNENDFVNEMLTQSVRHEVYLQTKNIRELLLARAMATSVIADEELLEEDDAATAAFDESDILEEWFSRNAED